MNKYRTIERRFIIAFIILYFALNLFNAFFILLPSYNNNMTPFTYDSFMRINSLLGNLAVLILVFGLLRMIRHKERFIFGLTLATVFFSLVIFGLKTYLYYYNTFFSFFNARTFTNPAPVLARQLNQHTFEMIFREGQYLTLLPGIIMLLLIIAFYRFKGHYYTRLSNETAFISNRKQRYMYALKLSLSGILLLFITQFAYFSNVRGTFFEEHRMSLKGAQTMGIYNYYIYDFVSYMFYDAERDRLDEQRKTILDDYIENIISKPCRTHFFSETTCGDGTSMTTENDFTGLFEGKNLIFVQLESFNDFLIDLTMNGQEVTPFMNTLAQRQDTHYYDNFYATIGVGKTSDAEFASITGIHPTGQIVTFYDYINDGFETLPKLFSERDYATLAITGGTEVFYRRHEVHPELGFDHSFGTESIDPTGEYMINGWTDDFKVFDFALNQLIDYKNKDQNVFMMLLTTILHLPFASHEELTGQFDWGIETETMLSNYLDYSRYTDNVLQYWFQQLELHGLLDDTVFLIYGDHTSSVIFDEMQQLDPELTRLEYQRMMQNVPFMLYAPGHQLPDTDTSLVRSQVDIKRTVANLFNIPIDYYFGIDILSETPTYAYNPQNLGIWTDEFVISATAYSQAVIDLQIDEDYLNSLLDYFYEYKALNDTLLRYHYFKTRDEEPAAQFYGVRH